MNQRIKNWQIQKYFLKKKFFTKKIKQRMGNSSSSFSTGLGGVSKVFPIGTFVRVPRKLSDDKIEAAKNDCDSTSWQSSMDETVGKIGIVLGGGAKPEHDIATVAFMVPNESVGYFFNYQSSWLEKVSVEDVPLVTRDWLRNHMRVQMRKLICHVMKERCPEVSKFGAVGTIVRVNYAPTAPSFWPFHMVPTLNQYGVVIGGRDDIKTTVFFPAPICHMYTYDVDWLTEVQSLDDLTLLPEQYNSLQDLRAIVLEAFQDSKQTQTSLEKILDAVDSDDDDTPSMVVSEPMICQQVNALELRVAALEKSLLALTTEKAQLKNDVT